MTARRVLLLNTIVLILQFANIGYELPGFQALPLLPGSVFVDLVR
jgi:hypothetical protein